MRKNQQKTLCLFFVLLLSIVISPALMAREITIIKIISFGTIDFHPGGDNIIISAQTGTAIPQASRSIVTGGSSGMIRIVSDIEEHVDIIYPESIVLRSGNHTITLKNIGDFSQYNIGGATVQGDGTPLDINMGGKLIFTGDEIDGNYSGSISITLNFE